MQWALSISLLDTFWRSVAWIRGNSGLQSGDRARREEQEEMEDDTRQESNTGNLLNWQS